MKICKNFISDRLQCHPIPLLHSPEWATPERPHPWPDNGAPAREERKSGFSWQDPTGEGGKSPSRILPGWGNCGSVLASYLLTASLSPLPALNRGTVAALIWIGSPVLGLRPVRAALLLTENVPKPTNVTESPLERDLVIPSTILLKADPASVLEIFASLAILSINSDFVMDSPFRLRKVEQKPPDPNFRRTSRKVIFRD